MTCVCVCVYVCVCARAYVFDGGYGCSPGCGYDFKLTQGKIDLLNSVGFPSAKAHFDVFLFQKPLGDVDLLIFESKDQRSPEVTIVH